MAFISAELKGVGTFIARVAGMPARIQKAAFKAMGVVARGLQAHVKSQHLSGQSLDPRTGNLRRAVFQETGMTAAGEAFARVGVDIKKAPYARVQELGGTIRAKKSRYLTIPLRAAQTAKGVGKFTARDVIGQPAAFGYTGTFVHNHIIFGKTAAGGIVPLFKLQESVVIKPVGFLSKSIEEKKEWVAQTVDEAVRTAFRESLEDL